MKLEGKCLSSTSNTSSSKLTLYTFILQVPIDQLLIQVLHTYHSFQTYLAIQRSKVHVSRQKDKTRDEIIQQS